jgi:hypothetical protein
VSKRAQSPKPEPPSEDGWGGVWRVVQGFLPAADGTVPVVSAFRGRLAWVVGTALGLLLGSACAFVVVLLLQAAPGVPGIVIGFGVGAFFGALAALVFASRYPIVRKGGALAILLFPVLVLAAPFLLLAGAVALLRKTAPRASAEVHPVKVEVERPDDAAGASAAEPTRSRKKPVRRTKKG